MFQLLVLISASIFPNLLVFARLLTFFCKRARYDVCLERYCEKWCVEGVVEPQVKT